MLLACCLTAVRRSTQDKRPRDAAAAALFCCSKSVFNASLTKNGGLAGTRVLQYTSLIQKSNNGARHARSLTNEIAEHQPRSAVACSWCCIIRLCLGFIRSPTRRLCDLYCTPNTRRKARTKARRICQGHQNYSDEGSRGLGCVGCVLNAQFTHTTCNIMPPLRSMD